MVATMYVKVTPVYAKTTTTYIEDDGDDYSDQTNLLRSGNSGPVITGFHRKLICMLQGIYVIGLISKNLFHSQRIDLLFTLLHAFSQLVVLLMPAKGTASIVVFSKSHYNACGLLIVFNAMVIFFLPYGILNALYYWIGVVCLLVDVVMLDSLRRYRLSVDVSEYKRCWKFGLYGVLCVLIGHLMKFFLPNHLCDLYVVLGFPYVLMLSMFAINLEKIVEDPQLVWCSWGQTFAKIHDLATGNIVQDLAFGA